MESVSPRSVLLKADVRGFALYCVPYDCYIVTFKYLLILKYISKINEKQCLSTTIFITEILTKLLGFKCFVLEYFGLNMGDVCFS